MTTGGGGGSTAGLATCGVANGAGGGSGFTAGAGGGGADGGTGGVSTATCPARTTKGGGTTSWISFTSLARAVGTVGATIGGAIGGGGAGVGEACGSLRQRSLSFSRGGGCSTFSFFSRTGGFAAGFFSSRGRSTTGGGLTVSPGTRTSPWHLGQRKVWPARLSETISECPEGHLIRSGMRLIRANLAGTMPTHSVCSL